MSAISPKGGTRKWSKIREVIMARDHWTCLVCGNPAQQVDHIIPRSKGGWNDHDNLQSLCTHCHNAKNQWENDKRAAHLRLTMPEALEVPARTAGPLLPAGGLPEMIRR